MRPNPKRAAPARGLDEPGARYGDRAALAARGRPRRGRRAALHARARYWRPRLRPGAPAHLRSEVARQARPCSWTTTAARTGETATATSGGPCGRSGSGRWARTRYRQTRGRAGPGRSTGSERIRLGSTFPQPAWLWCNLMYIIYRRLGNLIYQIPW